ncbi:MAG TPA: energy-coupling factor ABC transporter permease [Actinomycetota bacterium]|nr:energy-coupling factor ABC transporter permease [Actinomycetota bacterium]
MHIPDGFISAGTSLAAGVASAGGVGVCLKRSAATMEERQAPLAGLVAAFVFAAQMLNFPVALGTSGHLLGAVLATVLVGPWAGAICIALVLFVQALFFADGGLSALGLNVLNMALIGGLGGYAVFRATRGVLPRTRPMVVAASAVAAGLSVVLASIGFFVEYAIGGVGDVSLGAMFAATVGVHTLIGIGEAVITALTVSAVLAVRPDLVYGARDLLPRLEIRPSEPVGRT